MATRSIRGKHWILFYKLAKRLPPMRFALTKGRERYRAAHGTNLDLTRAWWTQPCAPLDAWNLETKHIHDFLDMKALVSLADHDNIDAPANLRILDTCREILISLEGTVPFENTFFHLGVHNLAADRARAIIRELEDFTHRPYEASGHSRHAHSESGDLDRFQPSLLG
jgi:hypothetical protein